jgi:glyoxylase-like metal-dependent hydrolase (beta-lactamase superfamily II)
LKNIKAEKLIDESCKIWKFPRSDEKENLDEFNQLKDGDEFTIDDTKIRVVFTPGHTTDHVILFDVAKKAVFSGDCILGEGTAVFEDLYDYMRSLEKILSLKPAIIYPAHGNVINDPIPRIEFYIQHRNQREKQILKALIDAGKALNEMEIVAIVYKETPQNLWPAARVNVHQHLIKLRKEEKIKEVIENHESYWQIVNNKL